MNEEQRQTDSPSPALRACLNRLKEMGVQVDKPINALTWYDVARVMVETEGFEKAANLPTDVLVHTLNTVQDGLEYLDWYDNIQKRKFTLTCSQQDWPNATHTKNSGSVG